MRIHHCNLSRGGAQFLHINGDFINTGTSTDLCKSVAFVSRCFFFFFAFPGEGFEIINSLFDNVLSERGLREICGGILLFKRL